MRPLPAAIQLVVTDLDGTVLGRTGEVPPSVSDAVARSVDAGVCVMVATGRTYAAARRHVVALGADGPVICCHGALVHAPDGNVLRRVPMRGDDAVAAVAIGLACGVPVLAFWEDVICTQGFEAFAANPPRVLGLPPGGATPVPDLTLCVAERPPLMIQYLVIGHDVTPEIVRALGPTLTPERIGLAATGLVTLELTAATATKGTALAWVAAHLGIARAGVLAIGDHGNDVAMLEWAAIGLAVENASPAAIAAAYGRAPHVDDAALAWALGRYIGGVAR